MGCEIQRQRAGHVVRVQFAGARQRTIQPAVDRAGRAADAAQHFLDERIAVLEHHHRLADLHQLGQLAARERVLHDPQHRVRDLRAIRLADVIHGDPAGHDAEAVIGAVFQHIEWGMLRLFLEAALF